MSSSESKGSAASTGNPDPNGAKEITTTSTSVIDAIGSPPLKLNADPSLAIFVQPPPPANIPSAPPGFVPTQGNAYRGVVPKAAELVALPEAVDELRTFASWATTLGVAGYPQDQVVQILDAAGQWSTMRNVTAKWDGFCREQEGIVWILVRTVLERLRPAWEVALAADATLATRYPKLGSFLSAKKKIAAQAVATREANAKAVAAGLPPYHGAVGKKRKAADERKAAAAAKAAAEAAAAATKVQPETSAASAVSAAGKTEAAPAAGSNGSGASNGAGNGAPGGAARA